MSWLVTIMIIVVNAINANMQIQRSANKAAKV
jgi:hypothetical protein